LYPGGQQVVRRVASWPGQAAQRDESKIPSIIWYDSQGRPQAFCAEARSAANLARAEREHWCLAEQFKLHVHPPTMSASHMIELIPLPPRVSVEQIYSDILEYVYRQTQKFFEDREFVQAGGGQIWQRLSQQNAIDFVLCHPGGWGLQEQSLLRRAMVKAGLVSSVQMATERVKFVGEAEASVHYVMFHADLQSRLRVSLLHMSASIPYPHSLTQPGIDFAVCDAGGSTVDTTLYTVSSMTPTLTLRERRDSACGSLKYSLLDVFTSYVVTLGIQAGGIFVDRSAAEYFQKKFYDADLDPDQVTELMYTATQKFMTEVKPSFRDNSGDQLIAVADRHFSSPLIGIDRGYMTLTG
jgi:hypothetical protein